MVPFRRIDGRRLPVTVLSLAAGLFLTAGLAAATARASGPPIVAASIKPIHDLAADVMDGIARPHLLLPPGTSPHAYALKPSAARILAGSDLIVWIGPGLEAFLVKPIRTLGRRALALALAEMEGMVLHRTRGGGARDIDPHLWLDPANGRRIAREIATVLARIDPARARTYSANLAATLARIDRAEAEARAILAPVKNRPYIVFHDAFQYFERRFGAASVGAVTLSPERKPGARRVAAVRARIEAAGARCVFSEPQFEPALMRTILRGSAARASVLDPMGAAAGSYGGMLRAIARGIRDCLAR